MNYKRENIRKRACFMNFQFAVLQSYVKQLQLCIYKSAIRNNRFMFPTASYQMFNERF